MVEDRNALDIVIGQGAVMDKRNLGQQGLTVSPVGHGCMGISMA